MADNYTVNLPTTSGNTFASDDIGGTHYPRVKQAWGADGTANDASVTNPVPVQCVSGSGEMRVAGVAVTPKFAVIDAASSGDNTLVAAVTSKKIRVLSMVAVAAGSVNVRFESGAGGTALTGQMNLVANVGFVLPYNPEGWFETAAGSLLNMELSGAVSVDGCLQYIEV